jgi:hypothetical protein
LVQRKDENLENIFPSKNSRLFEGVFPGEMDRCPSKEISIGFRTGAIQSRARPCGGQRYEVIEMSEQQVVAPAAEAASLSQLERVGNTFTAPSTTFAEIQGGKKSWWLPFVILSVVSYILFAAITAKVGWQQVAENATNQNPKTAERMAKLPAEQREAGIKMTATIMQGSFIASPAIVLLSNVIVAAVLLATINFVFGGKANFGAVFAVSMYAWLPSAIKSLLGAVVVYFTVPESFNINVLAPTNLAAFLNPAETNAALYKLLTALDVTTIWTLVLLSIGLATVAGVKRNLGYIAVFGWWALITLAGVGSAAIFG